MPKRTTKTDQPELKTVNFGAAAIDIGSKMHMAGEPGLYRRSSARIRHIYTGTA